MGTILSVARYGDLCWAMAEDLFVKFEERNGVGKFMSKSVTEIFDAVNMNLHMQSELPQPDQNQARCAYCQNLKRRTVWDGCSPSVGASDG